MRSARHDAEGPGLHGDVAPADGEVIAGRYQIRHRKRGSRGPDSFVAHDTRDGREVHLRLLDTPSARLRASRFRDLRGPWPRIIKLLEWRGRALVVEELPAGAPLLELVPAGGTLAPRYCLAALYQTLDALELAHAQGIHHDCLTLQSLFIRCEGEVLLLDWDAAEFVSGTRETDFAAVSRCAWSLLAPEDGPAVIDPLIQAAVSRLRERPWRSAREGREDIGALFEALFSRALEKPRIELLPLVALLDSNATVQRLERGAGDAPDVGVALLHASTHVRGDTASCSTPERGPESQSASDASLLKSLKLSSHLLHPRDHAIHLRDAAPPLASTSASCVALTTLESHGVPPEKVISPVAHTVPPPALCRRDERIELGTGDVVAGRYRIDALLGTGGMGQVFRARDTMLERTVALKLLKRGQIDEAYQDRLDVLLSEARAAASIQHPNIVSIYDVGEFENVPYIAMEYLDGVTLRHEVTNPRLQLRELSLVLGQVASALSSAHEKGIVHRDVKPENVILTSGPVAKVVDFGIATRTDDTLCKSPVPAGTLAYMAPELFKGHIPDRLTDQYAWGRTALELLRARQYTAGGRDYGDLTRVATRASSNSRVARFRNMAEVEAAIRALGARTSVRKRVALMVLLAVTLGALTLLSWISARRADVDTATKLSEQNVALGLGDIAAGRVSLAEAQFRTLMTSALPRERARASLWLLAVTQVDGPESDSAASVAYELRNHLAPAERTLLHLITSIRSPLVAEDECRRTFATLEASGQGTLAIAAAVTLRALQANRHGLTEDALAAASRHDPASPTLSYLRALALPSSSAPDAAIALFRACAEREPRAVDCVSKLVNAAINDGDCRRVEVLARQQINSAPTWAGGYSSLADALLPLQGPEAAEAAITRAWEVRSDPWREYVTLMKRAHLSVERGNLSGALALLRRARTASPKDSGSLTLANLAIFELELLDELDDEVGLREAASSFKASYSLIKETSGDDRTIMADALLYARGIESKAEFTRQRGVWLDQNVVDRELDVFDWEFAYGAAAANGTDAEEALRLLPAAAERTHRRDLSVLGKVLFLAADPRALDALKAAVNACMVIGSVERSRSKLMLAQTYERLGLRDDACAVARKALGGTGRPEGHTLLTLHALQRRLSCEQIVINQKVVQP